MSLITIGMPVFNDVRFINETLNSLLCQTFSDFILIISDDGSTDGSGDICQNFAEKDKRIKYIKQPATIGISRNMSFLLSQATTEYFMWAADDDLYAPDFIEKLIGLLKTSVNAISAFCSFAIIDDNGNIKSRKEDYDYSNNNSIKRLKYFIKNSNDKFGYGIFVLEKIKKVKFPIWWWPNKNCPLNNIFPSLCFYLVKGDYAHYYGNPLFFKREKSKVSSNYNTPYSTNGIKDTFAFILRRLYLVFFSSKMIYKGGGMKLSLFFFPMLFIYWFCVPSLKQINLLLKSLKTKFKA